MDFEKLYFNRADMNCMPVQVLFDYSTDPEVIEDFLLYDLGEDDVPEDDEILGIEFELFIYSMDNFKVECTLHGAESDYFIGDYIEGMDDSFASEWLEQIPADTLVEIKSIFASKEA